MINEEERKKLEGFVLDHIGLKTIWNLLPKQRESCIAISWIMNCINKDVPKDRVNLMCFRLGRSFCNRDNDFIWKASKQLVEIFKNNVYNSKCMPWN